MCPKDAGGMTNSVEPNQTANRSSLIWVYTACIGQSVQIIRIFKVHRNILFGISIVLTLG